MKISLHKLALIGWLGAAGTEPFQPAHSIETRAAETRAAETRAAETKAAKPSTKAQAAKQLPPILSPAELIRATKELRDAHIYLPIDGYEPEKMKGSFYEQRGSEKHEAVDMLAPRNTPVHAVCDGEIAKLFLSKPGGITIYQFDLKGKYVFYYAHLEKYAGGLKEDQKVKRGEIIAYVGTSGNAPKNTPHLHLSVGVLTPARKWWVSSPIDPYPIFSK